VRCHVPLFRRSDHELACCLQCTVAPRAPRRRVQLAWLQV
jgi:hypothetical protein